MAPRVFTVPHVTIEASQFPSGSLHGRTAVLTGASSGIGLSTALLLSSLGCNVLIGDLNPPPSALLTNPHGGRIIYRHCEVTSYASLFNLFKFSKSLAGFGVYPDIVFANAGIGERGTVFGANLSEEEMAIEPKHEVLDVDLRAVANTVRIGWWGIMKEGRKEGGSIIMTASVAGYTGQAGLEMYNGAKHGVVGLLRSLRYLSPTHNISISLVAPAITSTPLLSSPGASYETVVSSLTASGVPMNTPERIAQVVAWLVLEGKKANGRGMMIQNDEVVDLEEGIAKNRDAWMGERMAWLYKGGKAQKGEGVFEKMQGKMGVTESKL